MNVCVNLPMTFVLNVLRASCHVVGRISLLIVITYGPINWTVANSIDPDQTL